MRPLFFLLAPAAGTLLGCDGTPMPCASRTPITGAILAGPTDMLVSRELSVRGTLSRPTDATIYRVDVAGIPAMNNGFDYDLWSATIPIETLLGLADDQGSAIIRAVAASNCGPPTDLASFSARINREPGIRVERLVLAKPQIPNGESFLPATRSVSALLQLIANPKAAGAIVSLSSSTGNLSGTTGNQVTLVGDGSSDASAQVFFSSAVPGPALLTATAGGQLASASLTIAAPPLITPAALTLSSGQSTRASVQVLGGRVESCQATPAVGISVTSGTTDLMARPGAVDANGDGAVDLDFAVSAMLTQPATTTVSCRDPFGQTGTAVFSARP